MVEEEKYNPYSQDQSDKNIFDNNNSNNFNIVPKSIPPENSNIFLLGREELSNNFGTDSFDINSLFKRPYSNSNPFFLGGGNNSSSIFGFSRMKPI